MKLFFKNSINTAIMFFMLTFGYSQDENITIETAIKGDSTTYIIRGYKLNLKKAYGARKKYESSHGIKCEVYNLNGSNKNSIYLAVFPILESSIPLTTGVTKNTNINTYHFKVDKSSINNFIRDGNVAVGKQSYFQKVKKKYLFYDTSSDYAYTANYVKKQALAVDYTINKIGQKTDIKRARKLGAPVDARIDIITVGTNVSLANIIQLDIPGIGQINLKDLIKQKSYNIAHDCSSSTNSEYDQMLCSKIDKIRSIPDLSKTDMQIQAHRGIWGLYIQENTAPAFFAARDQGYDMIEADIMPYAFTNYTNPNAANFGLPGNLACFHDYKLSRFTNNTTYNYLMDVPSKSALDDIRLFQARSNTSFGGPGFFIESASDLVNFTSYNHMLACLDIKNLESNGTGTGCTEFCEWQDADRKRNQLISNIKNFFSSSAEYWELKNIAIKTYEDYATLKTLLTTGQDAITSYMFNKILWIPIIAPNDKWNDDNNVKQYDHLKLLKYIGNWLPYNDSVLYYETNFFNDYDTYSAIMLREDLYNFIKPGQGTKSGNIMEWIYEITGRRAGIFSEEPVGSRGVVNRWGSWKLKDTDKDRRGDHLWLLSKPFFKHAVITTDRPDQFKIYND